MATEITALNDIAERFAKDTGGWTSADGTKSIRPHEMTVLHDDGLYRHVRFRSPDTGAYWFDLITWPSHLTVTGDCGTFTFARTDDMFEFFRTGRDINPGYWAEKIRGETQVKSYSEDRFRQQVYEYAADAIRCGAPKGLARAIRSRLYGRWTAEWDVTNEYGAREALSEFSHGVTYAVTCPTCGKIAERLGQDEAHRQSSRHLVTYLPASGHGATPKEDGGFRFHDVWEWDLSDYDWWYLWSCHAIKWGIGQYDAAAKPAKAAVGG